MDLTQIRDIVFRKTKRFNPDIYDIDDALKLVHDTHIQPIAKVQGTADRTTTESDESVLLTTIASDVYRNRIDFIRNVSSTDRGPEIPLLNANNTQDYGVRISAGTVYFQGIESGVKARFYYQKKLKSLGIGTDRVTTPEIEEQWHDLYWLGAVAMLDVNYYPMFQDRLTKFKHEVERDLRPRGGKIKARVWG